jgi:hypothetical protein
MVRQYRAAYASQETRAKGEFDHVTDVGSSGLESTKMNTGDLQCENSVACDNCDGGLNP